MNLYPAIDILEGRAVRLVKGDFDASTVYEQDPLAAALAWVDQGAAWLHVVDLDGAKAGRPVNLEHLGRIAAETGVPVQYGGGLRSTEAVSEALAAGASRAILGTVAFADPPTLERALAEHGAEQVLVSVDARGGKVATHGWLRSTDSTVEEAVAALRETGVEGFVFTDIDRDGMLDGANLEPLGRMAEAVGEGRLIVSGGIGALADLERISALGLRQVDGVIVGKALYERRFTVTEALATLAA
ncbi:MAG TPA: 1-(5-phosphoribosyl)-5-[(5-phosphoribosylamino)methylideneamino]imidazole-4-carboxamide isomerase [Solirubrobacteraceae bacterium]|jgi:phosphoribosylformimino-5-aminoimidazole carboxamide ribotide isomerase